MGASYFKPAEINEDADFSPGCISILPGSTKDYRIASEIYYQTHSAHCAVGMCNCFIGVIRQHMR